MKKAWQIDESPEVRMQLAKSPLNVQRKYAVWRSLVEFSGPFLPGKGWKTEALHGLLKGFYSARLDRKWRVIFEYDGKIKSVGVLSITPHLYRRIQKR